ncbi:MAG: LysR family transcriptional regulator [Candidatus Nitrohelix vancouverensis]|uniref:LysR family transcriptional regulator n=1 Tax=Candidatus Nitrohelix vancouverensis TaxID=2705534 RepID=A0A7T0C2K9_9BACT|nr:MAG: LysR family transcriptional regulator [Candidatus Nitrohelix vancouverensis]
MRNLPNFNHLYYFWIIAREGSIKKAGQKLNLTQPGLSGQLKSLEDYFGKKLFDRKIRKLVLNDAGRVALEYCSNIFSLAEEMEYAVKQIQPKKQTLVRVGVLPSLSATHIHEFVVPLWKDKTVLVSVVENNLDELLFQLESKNLEIVLSDREVPHKRRLFSFRLRPRRIIAVGNHEFASARKNFPASLNHLPMIQLTEHSQIHDEIQRYFARHKIKPQIVGEADDVTLLRLAAIQGHGVAVLPENTANEAIAQGLLIRLGELKNVKSDMWALASADSKKIKIVEKTINRFLSKV